MTQIGVIGAQGRMGQAIIAAITEGSGLALAGGADQGDDVAIVAAKADVMIDFSAPAALEHNLDACMATQTPIVIGTTGLEERHHYLIDSASQSIAVLQTGNTSLGVTLLSALVKQAAAALGDDWDIEIVETHHRHKVDAPSGTALLLGEAAAKGRGVDLQTVSARGRDGITGARQRGDIGFASLRGGSVAGDHSILLATEHEQIILSHRAENRALFARGAIKAATWLMQRDAGRYDMADVLGIEN